MSDHAELEAAVRRYVACSLAQMRQEKGKGHCPHTKLFGGDQDLSCWALMVNALEPGSFPVCHTEADS